MSSVIIDGQRTVDVAGYILDYEKLCSGLDSGAFTKTEDMTLRIENRYFSAAVEVKPAGSAQESGEMLEGGSVEAYVLVVTAKTGVYKTDLFYVCLSRFPVSD